MAFPTLAATGTAHTTTTNQTSKAINCPAASTGDRLILLMAWDGNPAINSVSTVNGQSWTPVFAGNNSTNNNLHIYEIVSLTGNISSQTVTVGLSASEMGGARIIRIAGSHPTQPTEAAVQASGSTVSPNPLPQRPTWGVEDTLFMAVEGNDGNVSVSAYPTGHTGGTNTRAANTAGAGLGYSFLADDISAEDPLPFTISATDTWVATTLAIRPATTPHPTAPVVSITHVGADPWVADAMTEDSPSIAVESGDRLLVCYTKADRESQTDVTFSTLSGSTEAWTHHHVHIAASDIILAVASTVATATGNVVVRKVNTSGTATISAGWYVMVVRGMGAVGNVASGAGQSVSLAVSADSLVVMINSDWDAVSTLGTFVPSTGALEIARVYLNGAYDLHSAYWVGEAAGTRSYGTTGGSGTDFRVCAIEILAAGATTHSAQGTLATTAGLTGTAAKVTGTGGSLATTVGLSGTAEVVKSVGGALATTASLTGSAEVVKSVTGALATTVALSGAATVGVPPVTVAGELATTVALTGAAEVVTTPPVEVTGELATTVGLEGSAGLAVAATGEMATVVGLSGTAEIAAEPPPAVYRGLRDISAIYHGETPVTRVYHGEERL